MDIVLLVLSLALAGTCAGVWLWLSAQASVVRLAQRNDQIERQTAQRTDALRAALDGAEAEVRRLGVEAGVKGEVIQALARELRTPLTTVMGFTQLLQANVDAERLTPRQAQGLRQIEAAAAVLLALIEEADGFVASGQPATAGAAQRVDLRLALRQVCDGLDPQARAAGVTLACPPAASGLGVTADPGQMRALLRRLVENALRHARSGQTVEMTLTRQDQRVSLSLHDPGPAARLDRADRPFEPLDGVDARGGTTLGVGASQRLAERMGGVLSAAADAWGATVFTLTLPAATGLVSGPGLGQAVVLYVEDNPANVALMRHAAGGLGLTLHAAATGAEGLELARALRPDVILLDIGLPDMDGYAVKARPDADPATRDVPVIALTAATSPRDLRRGRAAGFDAYLTKPLDLTALAAALNDVLIPGLAGGGLDAEGRRRA